MGAFIGTLMRAAEAGYLPDALIRRGIRGLLKSRLSELPVGGTDQLEQHREAIVSAMKGSAIAICTEEANHQHYEVPPEYFDLVLGTHKKYSCCYWGDTTETLDGAEAEALAITCQRANIIDGQDILELGCGWGSLTLWMASHFPQARITAVSNSALQKRWIDKELERRRLDNVQVITADMNGFHPDGTFDRVVSLEMFEHMRNWPELFGRVADWLKPDGQFFMHVFCHRNAPYFFDDGNSDADEDWMSRYFFSGGLMPSFDLPECFQEDLSLQEKWYWEGNHYGKTLRAWLDRHDANRDRILDIFRPVYGGEAEIWFERWRLFYLACDELFRFNAGQEWFVGHYLFQRSVHRGR